MPMQMGGPAPLSYVKDKAPMEPSTQKLLADFYAPYNKALSELTGDMRFASEWINE